MKILELDKIMAAQCSKSTKSNDQALARIQALNSDALGPLTELLEVLNKEDGEITIDQVVAVVAEPAGLHMLLASNTMRLFIRPNSNQYYQQ